MRPLAASRHPRRRALRPGGLRRAGRGAGPPGDLVLLRAGAERTLTLGAGAPRALPAGQPAAGWRSLYTATPAGAATTVARVDVATGRTLRSLRLPGRWTLPATVIGGAPDAATADGRTLVLARAGARDTSSPWSTRRCAGTPRIVTLPGPLRLRRHRPRRAADVPHRAARRRPLPRAQLRPRARRAHARRRRRQARARRGDGGRARRPRRARRRAVGLHAVPQGLGPVRARAQHRGLRAVHRPAAPPPAPVAAAAGEWGLVLVPGDVRRSTPPTPRSASSSRSPRRRAPRSAAPPASRAARSARRRGLAVVARRRRTLYVPTARRRRRASTRRRCRCGGRCCAAIGSARWSPAGGGVYAQDGAVVTLDAASGAVLARTPTSAPPAALAAVLPAQ